MTEHCGAAPAPEPPRQPDAKPDAKPDAPSDGDKSGASGTPPPRNPFPCAHCARSFKSDAGLQDHVRVNHGPSSQAVHELLVCGTCNKRFNSLAAAEAHAAAKGHSAHFRAAPLRRQSPPGAGPAGPRPAAAPAPPQAGLKRKAPSPPAEAPDFPRGPGAPPRRPGPALWQRVREAETALRVLSALADSAIAAAGSQIYGATVPAVAVREAAQSARQQLDALAHAGEAEAGRSPAGGCLPDDGAYYGGRSSGEGWRPGSAGTQGYGPATPSYKASPPGGEGAGGWFGGVAATPPTVGRGCGDRHGPGFSGPVFPMGGYLGDGAPGGGYPAPQMGPRGHPAPPPGVPAAGMGLAPLEVREDPCC